jgi:hypothetical protein
VKPSYCLVAAALFLAPAAFAATPCEAGDLFKLSQVDRPQVSPDGKRAIFIRSYADITTDRRMSEVWLLTIGDGVEAEPVVSPDLQSLTTQYWLGGENPCAARPSGLCRIWRRSIGSRNTG